MKISLIVSLLTLLLHAENNQTLENNVSLDSNITVKNNTITDTNHTKTTNIDKEVQKQIEREKKFAKEQTFYQGDDYDLSYAEVNEDSLDSVPLIEPEYDFNMDDVYN